MTQKNQRLINYQIEDYDDGIDREWLYDCCVGLLTDEGSDLNGVNFQFLKNIKNEVIVRVWKEDNNEWEMELKRKIGMPTKEYEDA
jgi:hypothetical protein